jgi:pyruvate formate lyase activating enzyme
VQTADMTIADLKAGTPETFAAHTGGRLESVIENLTFAAAEAPALLIRIPLITGINDIPDERNAMTEILYRLHQLRRRKQNRNLAVELLKLHHFGAPKYRAMGQTYLLEGRPEPAPENVGDLEQKLTSLGMEIQKN